MASVSHWFGFTGVNVYNDHVDCKNGCKLAALTYFESVEVSEETSGDIHGSTAH